MTDLSKQADTLGYPAIVQDHADSVFYTISVSARFSSRPVLNLISDFYFTFFALLNTGTRF